MCRSDIPRASVRKPHLRGIIALGLAGLLIIRLGALQGLFVPVRIAGPSMAFTFLGDHYQVTCADCGFLFCCDAGHVPSHRTAVCPNCGYAGNQLEQRVRGDRVLVDHLPLVWRTPRRFEIVAFRDGAGELSVKRVVGLPRERLSIRDGNVFVNGQIVRKTPEQFRATAVLVHDNGYVPRRSRSLPPRWSSDSNPTGWQARSGGFLYTPPTAGKREAHEEWLNYHHWRCFAAPSPRSEENPVADNVAYNQAESRVLSEVSELLLRCQVRPGPNALMRVRLDGGRTALLLRIDCSRRHWEVRLNDRFCAEGPLPAAPFQTFQLEFGNIDEQAFLSIDARTLLLEAVGSTRICGNNATTPVGLQVSGDRIEVSGLQLWRDIFYLNPQHTAENWEMSDALGDQHFFLLGDNTAVSVNGRHWSKPGVETTLMLGPVRRLGGGAARH